MLLLRVKSDAAALRANSPTTPARNQWRVLLMQTQSLTPLPYQAFYAAYRFSNTFDIAEWIKSAIHCRYQRNGRLD